MNHLVNTRSAFLRQAVDSPIDWYPWTEDAFERARAEDKLIVIDVGASWCHWCHVMDEGTYRDEEVVKLINENFIAIKVDRDEMPDIDRQLQLAVSSITGESGWPLTVFMTPDGKVFFGGTYFPPNDSFGRPGLRRVLREIIRLWRNERDKILQAAEELASSLRKIKYQRLNADSGLIEDVVSTIIANFDVDNGGLAGSMKFPHPTIDQLLIAHTFYTGNNLGARLALLTLRKMYYGGIFDQVGGGFHRYTVDSEWYVPHFEKLLIDNAELLMDYTLAYQYSGDSELLDAVNLTVDFLLREMRVEGGFANSMDADSEGIEGYYYTWTMSEFMEALVDEDVAFWARFFNVDFGREVEGRKVIRRNMSLSELGERFSNPLAKLSDIRTKLRLYREAKRRHPFIDTNTYTHSNCRAAEALLSSYPITGKGLNEALNVVNKLTRNVTRRLDGGKDGLPEDYASALLALISAYEVTGDVKYRDLAVSIGRELMDMGNEYPIDLPNESNASLIMRGLLKLSMLSDEIKYTPHMYQVEAPYIAGVAHNSLAFMRGMAHVVIVNEEDGRARDLHRVALTTYYPFKVVEVVNEGITDYLTSYVRAMLSHGKGKSRAYVCVGNVCNLPVDDPGGLRKLLTANN